MFPVFDEDRFDGNSELVAELVTSNGFKSSYVIKDGAEGPRGWKKRGLPWIQPKKTFNLDPSDLMGAIGDAFGEASDSVPLALGVAAAAVLDYWLLQRWKQYLIKNGVYDFWNWFDDRTWYPLGYVICGTIYLGLTLTAGTIWRILNSFNIPVSVQTVCVFTTPLFSAFASWSIYLVTKSAWFGKTGEV